METSSEQRSILRATRMPSSGSTSSHFRRPSGWECRYFRAWDLRVSVAASGVVLSDDRQIAFAQESYRSTGILLEERLLRCVASVGVTVAAFHFPNLRLDPAKLP